MDPLTHMLTGACMSRAGLNRKTTLATLTLVLSAEVSDLDFLAYFGGPVFGFAHHRGITHTFLGVPVMAALALGMVWVLNRLLVRWKRPPAKGGPPRWGLLYGYACLGALSHILLDFTNNYGVRPFAPFYPRWFSWDIVSIVEPLLLLPLLAGLIVPSLFRLIQEEVGARRAGPRGRGGAIFALVCVLVLWGLRDFEHRRAVAALESRLYHGAEPLRVSAYPYDTNPFLWYGVVETQDSFETMHVDSLTPEVDPRDRARIRYKPEETPASLAAKKSYLGRVYLDWAQYPMFEVEQRDSGETRYLVRFY
ncbi:MAG: metal-dependent hydrolase, partial [Terriglobales bacterium]